MKVFIAVIPVNDKRANKHSEKWLQMESRWRKTHERCVKVSVPVITFVWRYDWALLWLLLLSMPRFFLFLLFICLPASDASLLLFFRSHGRCCSVLDPCNAWQRGGPRERERGRRRERRRRLHHREELHIRTQLHTHWLQKSITLLCHCLYTPGCLVFIL